MERFTTSAVGWNAILRCFATLSGDTLKRTMFSMLQVGRLTRTCPRTRLVAANVACPLSLTPRVFLWLW